MISFGYPKPRLTLVWPSFPMIVALCARANFAHAFLLRCFDNTVLLKQSDIGRYCDVSLYNDTWWKLLTA